MQFIMTIFYQLFPRAEGHHCTRTWARGPFFLANDLWTTQITTSSSICGRGGRSGHLLPRRLSKPSSLYLQLFSAPSCHFLSRAFRRGARAACCRGMKCGGGRQKKKIENGVVKRRFLSDSFSVTRRQHKQHDGQVKIKE